MKRGTRKTHHTLLHRTASAKVVNTGRETSLEKRSFETNSIPPSSCSIRECITSQEICSHHTFHAKREIFSRNRTVNGLPESVRYELRYYPPKHCFCQNIHNVWEGEIHIASRDYTVAMFAVAFRPCVESQSPAKARIDCADSNHAEDQEGCLK